MVYNDVRQWVRYVVRCPAVHVAQTYEVNAVAYPWTNMSAACGGFWWQII